MSWGSNVLPALLGRERERSLLVLGISIVLFAGVFILGSAAETRGWEVMIHVVVALVLVVGGAIAAGNAYWNDGIVGSWILVFSPVFAWLWNAFVQRGPVFFAEAVPPFAWAVFSSLVVGTVGYASGRGLREFLSRNHGDEPTGWLFRLLVGEDPERSVQWGLLAGGLLGITAFLLSVTRPDLSLPAEGIVLFELFFPTRVLVADPLLGALVVSIWIGLATWPAYRNGGLLVSWGLVFAPMFGAILVYFVTDGLSGSGPFVDGTLAFLTALLFAIVLGSGGFILGRSLRRALGRRGMVDEQSSFLRR